jgi:hypothetical protein
MICLDKSSAFLEAKFYILDKFIRHFEYYRLDKLLTILEKHLVTCDLVDSYLHTNINPIKTSVLLMDFCDRIEQAYDITEFRVNSIRDNVRENLGNILRNIYHPAEIKMQVTAQDIFKLDALSYMERMDAYTLMDTKIMDRIMKELWHSDID